MIPRATQASPLRVRAVMHPGRRRRRPYGPGARRTAKGGSPDPGLTGTQRRGSTRVHRVTVQAVPKRPAVDTTSASRRRRSSQSGSSLPQPRSGRVVSGTRRRWSRRRPDRCGQKRRALAQHHDGAGFFGFFETEPDPAIAPALFDAASAWLAKRGLAVMRGPASFSVNEECGLLVHGFETPPAVMMPHNPPWYPEVVERSGFKKAKDLIAYRAPGRPGA